MQYRIVLGLCFSTLVWGSNLRVAHYQISSNKSVRMGIQDPIGFVRADLLYLHGLGDRMDNHAPLFNAWSEVGVRVIAFDFPSHGESDTWPLDFYDFEELAELSLQIEEAAREDRNRPLFIAGWSMGGLLAIRMAQMGMIPQKLKGLILFAPGVAVYPLVGGDGIIREETLTNNLNPPHRGEIKPRSPFLRPLFAKKLLINSRRSRSQTLPSDLPILTFVADDEDDLYAKSPDLKEWVVAQRSRGVTIYGLSCPGSKHEMDNEPHPIGSTVRALSSTFINNLLENRQQRTHHQVCQSF